jgi:hypothetical protein
MRCGTGSGWRCFRGVAPVVLVLARTDDTVVRLTDVRGYPEGFVFLLRVRWGAVSDRYEEAPWPFPHWGSPDPLDGDRSLMNCK